MKRLLAGVLAWAAVPWALGAQAAFRPEVSQVENPAPAVARARALQDAGHWDAARDLLVQTSSRCGAVDACRLVVFRALGDGAQTQARRDAAAERKLLEESVGWYRRALRAGPSDGPSNTNLALALRTLGDASELERFLPQAMAHDSSGTALYALLLGDVYRDREAWLDALQWYRRAMALAPEDEAPRRRLVRVYRELPDSAPALYRQVSSGSEWESRFPDASARAYAVVVNATATRDRDIATAACVRWARTLADADLLTPDRFAAIEPSWLAKDVAALQAFVVDPLRGPPTGFLWTSDAGRDAVGRVALAAGRRRIADGDAKGADAYWNAGLQATQDASPIALDLMLEAATLYQQRPDLDPNSARFHDLEQRLIAGKAEAYFRADDEAIQRFHTVLGLIYTRRGVIGSSGEPWSATFQLEHALATAHKRDSLHGAYQPLPQLRALLADAYRKRSRPEATTIYLEAAQAYLDVDALNEAQQMLDSSGPAADSVQGGAARRALTSLIRARATANPGGAERPPAERCQSQADASAGVGRAAGLSAAFVGRQRFKILADCLVGGSAPVRPEDAARVLTTAADERIPLVGTKDIVRLQRSQTAVRRVVRVPPEGGVLQIDPKRQSTVPSATLDHNLLLGARVIARVGADTAVHNIEVKGGEVTAQTSNLSEAAQRQLQAAIQGVSGVQASRVRAAAAQLVPPAPPPAPPPPPPTPPPAPPGKVRPGAAIVAPGLRLPAMANALQVRPLLEAALTEYARALESGNLDVVRRVVADFDVAAVDALFKRTRTRRVTLVLEQFTVQGETAQGEVTGTIDYAVGRLPRRDPVKQHASFARTAEGWRLAAIK